MNVKKENHAREENVFSRGLHALRAVRDNASHYLNALGEKSEMESRLFSSVISGDELALSNLIQAGVDPLAAGKSKIGTDKAWTPLHAAIANNNEHCAILLVKAIYASHSSGEVSKALGIPEGQYGDSPLMMAVKFGQSDAVAAMMRAGADASQANKQGVTPFMEMCRRGNQKMVESTLENLSEWQTSAMLHKVDNGGMNSLFHAISGGATTQTKIDLIEIHSKNKFDCAAKYGDDGYTALHVASLVGQPFLIRDLVDNHKADVNSFSAKEGLTPTMVASWSNQPESVKMLSSYPQLYIDAKRGVDESTALHMAGVRGHQEVIIALVQCGSDCRAENMQKQTPAELAKFVGQTESAQLLKRLDPSSTINTSLTKTLMQRAERAVDSFKNNGRSAPSL